jgi:hypothetical protein
MLPCTNSSQRFSGPNRTAPGQAVARDRRTPDGSQPERAPQDSDQVTIRDAGSRGSLGTETAPEEATVRQGRTGKRNVERQPSDGQDSHLEAFPLQVGPGGQLLAAQSPNGPLAILPENTKAEPERVSVDVRSLKDLPPKNLRAITESLPEIERLTDEANCHVHITQEEQLSFYFSKEKLNGLSLWLHKNIGGFACTSSAQYSGSVERILEAAKEGLEDFEYQESYKRLQTELPTKISEMAEKSPGLVDIDVRSFRGDVEMLKEVDQRLGQLYRSAREHEMRYVVAQSQNEFEVSAGKAGQWGHSSSEFLFEAIQEALWELNTTETQDNSKELNSLKSHLSSGPHR